MCHPVVVLKGLTLSLPFLFINKHSLSLSLSLSLPTEQKHLDSGEMNNLRNDKVNPLNDLEHKQAAVGTSLKPLSPEEWQAVRQVMGRG